MGKIPKESYSSNHHVLQFLSSNLNKLVLEFSDTEQDPMTILEKLSNLRFLYLGKLNTLYKGDELVCSAHGCPKLETLQFTRLLKEWHVAKGALPSLKRLNIEDIFCMKNDFRWVEICHCS